MLSQYIQFALLLALPAIYAGAAAAFTWSSLNRPWLFLVSCAVSLYAIYIDVFYFGLPRSQGFVLERTDQAASGSVGSEVVSSFLGLYIKPIALFSVIALPSLWLLVKLFRR